MVKTDALWEIVNTEGIDKEVNRSYLKETINPAIQNLGTYCPRLCKIYIVIDWGIGKKQLVDGELGNVLRMLVDDLTISCPNVDVRRSDLDNDPSRAIQRVCFGV